MKIIFLILTINLCITITSQESQEANYLIPYNNDGKWGWCDTLGNVLIEAEYETASFFGKSKNSKPAEAYVEINGKKNYYIYGIGLKIPEEYKLIQNVFYLDENNKENQDLVIIENKTQLGLYDTKSKKTILKPIYNSIYSIGQEQLNILYKAENEKFFSLLYYDKTYKYDSTDIIKREKWNQYLNNFVEERQLYKHSDSSWTRFYKNSHIIESFKEGRWNQEELYYSAYDYDMSYSDEIEKENLVNDTKLDGLIDSYDYSIYPNFMKKYGFNKLKIMRKEGKIGLITENDSIIVAFEYDSIYFNENTPTYAKLIKDNKEGIKLFFTNYPIIKAKYDKILNFEYPEIIEVSKNWSFVVFLIELNGQKGYIGENGIEYFNIK